MTRLRAVQIAALASAALGCSGSDEGGGEGGGDTRITINTDDYGGFVALGKWSLIGVFYSDFSITPDPGALRFGATEKCELKEGDADRIVTSTYLDVGVDIRAVSGSTMLVALNYTSDEEIRYLGSSTSGAPNAVYTISLAGSADVAAGEIGTLFVPNSVSLPSPVVVPGEPLTLEWTATGADVVSFDFKDVAGPPSYSCQVNDDGEFTIPGEITQAIGADGGIYEQVSQTFEAVEVNGRTVLLAGIGFSP